MVITIRAAHSSNKRGSNLRVRNSLPVLLFGRAGSSKDDYSLATRSPVPADSDGSKFSTARVFYYDDFDQFNSGGADTVVNTQEAQSTLYQSVGDSMTRPPNWRSVDAAWNHTGGRLFDTGAVYREEGSILIPQGAPPPQRVALGDCGVTEQHLTESEERHRTERVEVTATLSMAGAELVQLTPLHIRSEASRSESRNSLPCLHLKTVDNIWKLNQESTK
jgi:hypothetical protein